MSFFSNLVSTITGAVGSVVNTGVSAVTGLVGGVVGAVTPIVTNPSVLSAVSSFINPAGAVGGLLGGGTTRPTSSPTPTLLTGANVRANLPELPTTTMKKLFNYYTIENNTWKVDSNGNRILNWTKIITHSVITLSIVLIPFIFMKKSKKRY